MALKKIFLALLFFASTLAGGVIALAFSDSVSAAPPQLQAADPADAAKFSKSTTPIFMAGTPKGPWLVIPHIQTQGTVKKDVAEIWFHDRFKTEEGADVWRQASFEGSNMLWATPQSIAVLSEIDTDDDGRARESQNLWVLYDKDKLNYFTGRTSYGGPFSLRGTTQNPAKPGPPLTGECIAATGDRLFVLARGPLTIPAATPATPGTASASSASSAANAASNIAPAPDEVWQILQHHVSHVDNFPPLGNVGVEGETPSARARITMVATPVQLTVAWREPLSTRLFFRTLPLPRPISTKAITPAAPVTAPATSTAPATTTTTAAASQKSPAPSTQDSGPKWSATTTVDFSKQDEGDAVFRILSANIDNRAVIAWATQREKTLDLRGIIINNDGKLADAGKIAPIFPIDLGPKSESVNPNDVAFAQSGTSMMIVFARPDGKLYGNSFPTFANAAVRTTAPAVPATFPDWQEINATNPKRADTQLVQNIMVVLVAILIVACLFQFRKRPAKVGIPKGRKLATLSQRLYGAAIDISLPLAAVLIYTGEFTTILRAWAGAFLQPVETFTDHPEILWVLGLYVLHTTIGELATGRSIGKAFAGTQVVSSDGTRASKPAIFLRNFVKIFELTTSGLLLVYLLISPFRQRLGDFFAHTLVLDATPVDPNDPEQKRERKREEELSGKK